MRTLTEKEVIRFNTYLRLNKETQCIEWSGCRTGCGYGQYSVDGDMKYTHRIAWLLAGNTITEEKPYILHNCPSGDNPACCNVEHLFAGTPADNTYDMLRKNRQRKGLSGLPRGVRKHGRGYAAQTAVAGKNQYLGTYDTIEEARIAAELARAAILG